MQTKKNRNVYYAVLNYIDKNGKRQQPWRSTGLTIKGNKKLAEKKAEEIRIAFQEELNKESYCRILSARRFKQII